MQVYDLSFVVKTPFFRSARCLQVRRGFIAVMLSFDVLRFYFDSLLFQTMAVQINLDLNQEMTCH